MKYFVIINGITEIQDWEADMSNHPLFEQLNDTQMAFYKEHPNASVAEVRQCKINEVVHIEVPFVLSDYKKEKLRLLSNLSLQTLGTYVSEYQLMNARLSLEAEGDDKIYDDAKSRHYIDTYLRVGKQCRELYYAAVADFEDAQTKEDVDQLYNQYNESYGEVD